MENLLSYEDVAKQLKTGKQFVRALVRKGKLNPIRISHRVVRFTQDEVTRYLSTF